MIPGGEVLPIHAVGQQPRRHRNSELNLNASNLIVIGQRKQSLACSCLAAKEGGITDGCQARERERGQPGQDPPKEGPLVWFSLSIPTEDYFAFVFEFM